MDDDDGADISAYHVDDEAAALKRLDKVLAALCPDLSRTRLKNLIEAGDVHVNGQVRQNASASVSCGDEIIVRIPPPIDATPVPEDIPLDIIFEDDDLLVLNKQAGLVVHPGAGNHTGTLVNALLYHCGQSLSGIGGVMRPGIVHRLDKETSGLMLVAKNDFAHRALAAQLADRSLSRNYMAFVWKVPQPPLGRVAIHIGRHPTNRLKMAAGVKGGRDAATRYKTRARFGESAALVECALESGRTHQVRVHMAHIGHPLIGDPLYGAQTNAAQALVRKAGISDDAADVILQFPRQALHAWSIAFIHPRSLEEMHFESDLPEDLETLKNTLKSVR